MKNLIQSILLTAIIAIPKIVMADVSDPVREHLKLIRDGIQLTMEKLDKKQDPNNSIMQPDSNAKLAAFNQKARAALAEFEATVQNDVLGPISRAIAQYNAMYTSQSYSQAEKDEVLPGLKRQLDEYALGRADVLRNAITKLYSPFPSRWPIKMDVQISKVSNDCVDREYYIMGGSFCRKSEYIAMASANISYLSGSKQINKQFIPKEYVEGEGGYLNIEQTLKLLGVDLSGTELDMMSGCYSSLCYRLTKSTYSIYYSLVSSQFYKPIKLSLADNNKIIIDPRISFKNQVSVYEHYDKPNNSGSMNILETILKIEPTTVVKSLYFDISEARYKMMAQMEAVLKASNLSFRDCKSSVTSLKKDICKTNEGCLSAGEIYYFKSLASSMEDDQGNRAECAEAQ